MSALSYFVFVQPFVTGSYIFSTCALTHTHTEKKKVFADTSYTDVGNPTKYLGKVSLKQIVRFLVFTKFHNLVFHSLFFFVWHVTKPLFYNTAKSPENMNIKPCNNSSKHSKTGFVS